MIRTHHLSLLVALLFASLALFVTACEIDDDGGDVTDTSTTDTSTTPTNATVTFDGGNFNTVTITVGGRVTWTNGSSIDMIIDFADDSGIPDSGTIAPGGTHSQTFSSRGTYDYTELNSSALGRVIVE